MYTALESFIRGFVSDVVAIFVLLHAFKCVDCVWLTLTLFDVD